MDRLLVTGCDQPFLPTALLQELVRYEGVDVVVPRLRVGLEPLCAVYSVSCLGAVEEALRSGRRKVTAFYSSVRVRYLDEEGIRRYGRPEVLFFNVNTPRDYRRALQIAGEV